ncbi:cupin domain-containing protein [Leifsonia aquatica]|uniref:cupin domain-containing protein n=1 Tax=Leifsonia aquatica TaxID=144185 RepID=UPI0028AFE2DF|nr:cupin domain-containing protein [Leifsonia aquatica]
MSGPDAAGGDSAGTDSAGDRFAATGRVDALTLPLEHEEVPDAQRVSGTPRTGLAELGSFGGSEVGVWDMTPGTMSDVESDELFVVIAGCATIEFVATGDVLEIGPGDVVRLSAGDETVWTVTETLRKIWLA